MKRGLFAQFALFVANLLGMTMADRIEMIRRLLEKEPNDVFLSYSLAMEYASAGQTPLALEQFERVLALDGEYLPAYAEAGKLLRAGGQIDQARRMFQRGLDLAAAKGQNHTRDYLAQQLEGLAGR
jgi:tetratricopeptide (TPR) repeat protein